MGSLPAVASAESHCRETRVFSFQIKVLIPMLAVGVVGPSGLLIWLYQMFQGQPTG